MLYNCATQVGIVQTAYANGASTDYLQCLGVQIGCTPTGVKHLHHAAVDYDVGVYFEANGHGTVLFSQALLDACAQLEHGVPAAAQLLALSRLINQAVGDAISGVLLVEVALRLLGDGDGMAWWAGLYEDLPSRQTKVLLVLNMLLRWLNMLLRWLTALLRWLMHAPRWWSPTAPRSPRRTPSAASCSQRVCRTASTPWSAACHEVW